MHQAYYARKCVMISKKYGQFISPLTRKTTTTKTTTTKRRNDDEKRRASLTFYLESSYF